eukprot:Rhum_TRINITY_DN5275_c0_g1::Rhum_TRINITY_DN5275_c0_g1_i1::g.16981::m.16981
MAEDPNKTPKKPEVTGTMAGGDTDSEESSEGEEEDGVLVVEPSPPAAEAAPAKPDAAAAAAAAAAAQPKALQKKLIDSDEDVPPASHVSPQHEFAGLASKLKGKGRGGYRSGIAHSVTRDNGVTVSATVVANPRQTAPGGAGARPFGLVGQAQYGDDVWGDTRASEFVGTVGGIRPALRGASPSGTHDRQ